MTDSNLTTTQPITEMTPEVVKVALPATKPINAVISASGNRSGHSRQSRKKKGKHRGTPSFDNWFCQVYPKDFTYPAWRSLSKTATDVAHLCMAKFKHAYHSGSKAGDGRPVFSFSYTEAQKTFHIPRPTFMAAMKLLKNVGMLEQVRSGGIIDGKGIAAIYTYSENWKTWQPPKRDNNNITKAREVKKQNRSKAGLTKTGKEGLTTLDGYEYQSGKAGLTGNAYFPV